jgi:chaperone required for assembly of F1-ATPase
MRNIFEDLAKNQPLDPREAARRGARAQLRKRFYQQASAGDVAGEGGAPLLLDGKPVKTPARRVLAAPTPVLAQVLAREWNAQEKVIDPGRMPLTRLANAIIDAVTDKPQVVAEEIAKYLGSDLLCYRAEGPAGLIARQAQAWDPVLEWAHETFGARLLLAQGVVHVKQPQPAMAALRGAIPVDPWRLGAVSAITTLTGSGLLALALAHRALDAEAVWNAAHVDEDWQMEKWGRDEQALERRAYRRSEFAAAEAVLRPVL